MHTINTPPHTYTQVTLLHTHICLACRANSPLTVERTLELFCRVFLDAVFDDLAKNVCMAIALSADTCLLIESSLLHLPHAHQPRECQVHIKWKLFFLEISTSTCLPRCTQTTAHSSHFFVCDTGLRDHTKSF